MPSNLVGAGLPAAAGSGRRPLVRDDKSRAPGSGRGSPAAVPVRPFLYVIIPFISGKRFFAALEICMYIILFI